MTHRINNNEMNPKTECGLKVDSMARSHTLALAHIKPTCQECLKYDVLAEEGVLNWIKESKGIN